VGRVRCASRGYRPRGADKMTFFCTAQRGPATGHYKGLADNLPPSRIHPGNPANARPGGRADKADTGGQSADIVRGQGADGHGHALIRACPSVRPDWERLFRAGRGVGRAMIFCTACQSKAADPGPRPGPERWPALTKGGKP
jgi:hypothetical protein